jgi:hypothetical protein
MLVQVSLKRNKTIGKGIKESTIKLS